MFNIASQQKKGVFPRTEDKRRTAAEALYRAAALHGAVRTGRAPWHEPSLQAQYMLKLVSQHPGGPWYGSRVLEVDVAVSQPCAVPWDEQFRANHFSLLNSGLGQISQVRVPPALRKGSLG